jgi:hypothetical protein
MVFEAPNLPLTGVYLEHGSEQLPTFDQAFMFCMECGHGQLQHVIASSVLYDETYTHRTSLSPIATRGNDFFLSQVFKVVRNRKFRSLLEVGCNDLYLLNRTQDLAEHSVGIDPIWIGKDHSLGPKTRVLGRFIEDLHRGKDLSEPPDIVLSAHTFEHIFDLFGQLASLVEIAADKCLFMIEVPSLDTLVKIGRFDQIFHQHLQYTSLSSMRRLVSRLGCQYLGHGYNYSYWGGTFLFWFQKGGVNESPGMSGFESQNFGKLREAFAGFQATVRHATVQASALKEDCYGFGAAQMLPVLAYHMESDLGFMRAILDDNQERQGKRLPGITPLIRAPDANELDSAAVMLTALDSSRDLLKRLIALNPRRIIHPLHCY